MNRRLAALLFLGLSAGTVDLSRADDSNRNDPGYRLILDKAYVPSQWDQETFDNTYRVWPAELRKLAEKATLKERRALAFERYGLTRRPGEANDKPLQFVVDPAGNWSANCFTCHGGRVAGKIWPGAPNSHYALQTLTEEIVATKRLLGKSLNRDDVSSLLIPLGSTHGTTNAVIFGIALGMGRDPKLNVIPVSPLATFVHHDMDAPPWWHFKRRTHIYIDGFAQKSPRALMQFALNRQNGPERFREWEDDFKKIYSWIESVEPPKYPYALDKPLAARGKVAFEERCSRCHGKYGDGSRFPHRLVPHKSVATDKARLLAITDDRRRDYEQSWFAHFGKHKVRLTPNGYVAPPLNGVWASAPYLHNGSVPTLSDVLNPKQRPVIWRRNGNGYDAKKVGLQYERVQSVPDTKGDRWRERAYFDTRKFGKSNTGHNYPNQLSESEKNAVLEYLKTL